jgi:hypothetical protein
MGRAVVCFWIVSKSLRQRARESKGPLGASVMIRAAGFALIAVSLAMFHRALGSMDRRELVACALATLIGWLTLSAGVEFVRSETAE